TAVPGGQEPAVEAAEHVVAACEGAAVGSEVLAQLRKVANGVGCGGRAFRGAHWGGSRRGCWRLLEAHREKRARIGNAAGGGGRGGGGGGGGGARRCRPGGSGETGAAPGGGGGGMRGSRSRGGGPEHTPRRGRGHTQARSSAGRPAGGGCPPRLPRATDIER